MVHNVQQSTFMSLTGETGKQAVTPVNGCAALNTDETYLVDLRAAV